MKALAPIALTLSFAAIPATAQDVTITLTPGLYNYETSTYMNDQETGQHDPYQYCIPAERARTSLNKLLEKFSKGGECNFGKMTQTSHHASGRFSCFSPDLGITVNGKLEGEYSPKHYTVTTRADTPLGEHKSIVNAKWISPCPKDWTPPPDISHD